MAGEHTESETHSEGTNGVSKSGGDSFATARAAFVASEASEAAAIEDKAKPAKPVSREVADDDSDLDEDDVDLEADLEAAGDEDSDLDEDEEPKAEDEDDDSKTGIDKIRRTEKRMREQLKKERSDAEAEIRELAQRTEQDLEQKWGKRIETAEKFEKLAARVNVDGLGVLQALGLKEDGYEHLAQVLYTIAKGKDDPKARAAAAQLMKSRERDAEIDDLKKWREEREKNDKQSKEEAAADAQWNAFFDKVEKVASDKTPLAKALLKANPTAARDLIAVHTFRLAKASGGAPTERAVMIAIEKDRRQVLRDLGIDPKSRGAAAAVVADAKTKSAGKAEGKPAEKKPAKLVEEKKLSPREAFIASERKYD